MDDVAQVPDSNDLIRPQPTVRAFAPKYSGAAQAILISQISGKPFTARDTLNDATFSYAFGKGASTTRVAWATTSATVSYATKEPVTMTSQYGTTTLLTPVKGRISVALAGTPVYLNGELSDPKIG